MAVRSVAGFGFEEIVTPGQWAAGQSRRPIRRCFDWDRLRPAKPARGHCEMIAAKLPFTVCGKLNPLLIHAATLRSFLFATTALLLSACGPFHPPSFEKSVSLSRDNLRCVTTIRGTCDTRHVQGRRPDIAANEHLSCVHARKYARSGPESRREKSTLKKAIFAQRSLAAGAICAEDYL
jgi:hypothetical protein